MANQVHQRTEKCSNVEVPTLTLLARKLDPSVNRNTDSSYLLALSSTVSLFNAGMFSVHPLTLDEAVDMVIAQGMSYPEIERFHRMSGRSGLLSFSASNLKSAAKELYNKLPAPQKIIKGCQIPPHELLPMWMANPITAAGLSYDEPLVLTMCEDSYRHNHGTSLTNLHLRIANFRSQNQHSPYYVQTCQLFHNEVNASAGMHDQLTKNFGHFSESLMKLIDCKRQMIRVPDIPNRKRWEDIDYRRDTPRSMGFDGINTVHNLPFVEIPVRFFCVGDHVGLVAMLNHRGMHAKVGGSFNLWVHASFVNAHDQRQKQLKIAGESEGLGDVPRLCDMEDIMWIDAKTREVFQFFFFNYVSYYFIYGCGYLSFFF